MPHNFSPDTSRSSVTIEDYETYFLMKSATDKENQLHEFMKNMDSECDDIFYTDGLDFYAAVREAAKRRVDPSEAIYGDLHNFFKKGKSHNAPQTKKQQLRDIKGYVNGKKEGIAVIENIKPKLSGGVHKVIDQQIKDASDIEYTIKDKE